MGWLAPVPALFEGLFYRKGVLIQLSYCLDDVECRVVKRPLAFEGVMELFERYEVMIQADVNGLRNSIGNWLEAMADGLNPGRFRFCSKGAFVPVDGKAAQVSTCFAMKSAWQAGIWDRWNEERRKACIEFVKSFQTEDGWFKDSWLETNARLNLKDLARLALGRTCWMTVKNRKTENLRAETRQSAATLLMVGEKPDYPLPQEIKTTDDAKKYIDALDWSNPWGAGSHVSHQLFMLSVNKQCFDALEGNKNLVNALLQELKRYYHPDTGTWHKGNPPDAIKINGAMKVFSGQQWLNRPYPDTRALLDFALKQPFESDGCGFLNRLFVVYQAQKGVEEGYRQTEIRKLAQDALRRVMEFHLPDGGFSFYKNKSQARYYYASVSKGLPVSDLHGAAMFVWAIALCLELLGEDAPEGAEVWKAHKA